MKTIRKVLFEMEVGFISSKCRRNVMKARQLSVHELVLCGCLMRWKNHVTVAIEVGVGINERWHVQHKVGMWS